MLLLNSVEGKFWCSSNLTNTGFLRSPSPIPKTLLGRALRSLLYTWDLPSVLHWLCQGWTFYSILTKFPPVKWKLRSAGILHQVRLLKVVRSVLRWRTCLLRNKKVELEKEQCWRCKKAARMRYIDSKTKKEKKSENDSVDSLVPSLPLWIPSVLFTLSFHEIVLSSQNKFLLFAQACSKHVSIIWSPNISKPTSCNYPLQIMAIK